MPARGKPIARRESLEIWIFDDIFGQSKMSHDNWTTLTSMIGSFFEIWNEMQSQFANVW